MPETLESTGDIFASGCEALVSPVDTTGAAAAAAPPVVDPMLALAIRKARFGKHPATRFDEKVIRQPHDGCWEWTGTKNNMGYGLFYLGVRQILAHRASWLLAHGSIPAGRWVLHRCDNPKCVRVDHLFLGDPMANVADMVAKGRNPRGATHGLRIHPGAAASGSRHGHAKLTEAIVVEIRNMYADGPHTIRSLAQRFGVADGTITHILRGTSWSTADGPTFDAAQIVSRGAARNSRTRASFELADKIRSEYARGVTTLVQAHDRFIFESVKCWFGKGLDKDDVLQAGREGYLMAIQRFDLSMGTRLNTYAKDWAWAYAQKAVAAEGSAIAVGRSVDNQILVHRKAGREIPERLQLRLMLRKSLSLSAPVAGDEDRVLEDLVAETAPGPEETAVEDQAQARRRMLLGRAMTCMTERERDLIRRRLLADEPETLEELGARFEVTRERVVASFATLAKMAFIRAGIQGRGRAAQGPSASVATTGDRAARVRPEVRHELA